MQGEKKNVKIEKISTFFFNFLDLFLSVIDLVYYPSNNLWMNLQFLSFSNLYEVICQAKPIFLKCYSPIRIISGLYRQWVNRSNSFYVCIFQTTL